MDQKSGRVESGTHHLDKRLNGEAGRPAKIWEDDLNDFAKGEKTETTQSNDLENSNTWLVTTMNINEWEKKEKITTPNTLSTTDDQDPNTSNNTTSPATPRGRPRALRRH